MQCPIDGTQLVMTERSGVEIDYCPQCRGVWLDRGELDKIIERAASQPAPQFQDRERHRENDRDDDGPRDGRREDGYGEPHRKKKREGFLGDLFDF